MDKLFAIISIIVVGSVVLILPVVFMFRSISEQSMAIDLCYPQQPVIHGTSIHENNKFFALCRIDSGLEIKVKEKSHE